VIIAGQVLHNLNSNMPLVVGVILIGCVFLLLKSFDLQPSYYLFFITWNVVVGQHRVSHEAFAHQYRDVVLGLG
jgi:hypothetical protein